MSETTYRIGMVAIAALFMAAAIGGGAIIGIEYERSQAQTAEYNENTQRWIALGSCGQNKAVKDALTGDYFCVVRRGQYVDLIPVAALRQYQ